MMGKVKEGEEWKMGGRGKKIEKGREGEENYH